MPTLSEATSNFKISNNLTKGGNGLTVQLLRWINENPVLTRNTCYRRMSAQILIPGYTTKQIFRELIRMCNERILIDDRTSKNSSKNIHINYCHPQIPNEIIDLATEEQKDKAQEALGVASARFLTRKIPLAENKSQDTKDQVVEMPPQKVEVSIPKEKLKDGLSLTLTININLN